MKTAILVVTGLLIAFSAIAVAPAASAEDCELGWNDAACAARCIVNGESGVVDCAIGGFRCPPYC